MSLQNGTRIGPYEVSGKLGAGGMGEVYRANDSNLRRDVAIKVLPAGFTDDPDRLARFEREAQLLAALNHPNIAGIYGLEETDGNRCLILELVEGKTLAEMIDAGPLQLETAVGLALQIAEALEVAHEKGIIHRDLKPANIKVTPEGVVKVLDFGLAKAFTEDGADSAPNAAHSPTLTMAATQAGMIMGTAAYMSPEQAAGQAADRRADVWSFGVVLHEMLTGRQSFAGETVSHTLAAVLKDDPEWERLPGDMPPRLRELLESCLQKKARNRLQAIGDARIVLEAWLADPTAFTAQPAGEATALPAAAPAPARAPWILAGLLAIALVATAAVLWPTTPALRAPVQTTIALPDGQSIFRGYGSSVLLSPDGSRLAYVVEEPGQERNLFVRALDQWDGVQLTSGRSAYHPFFSPDGDWIGFVTRDAMYKVPIRGGSPIKLTEVSLNRGASWGQDGFIVFTPSPTAGLFRVPEAGGEAEQLTEVADLESHRWPQVLPGARAVLFTAVDNTETTSHDDARIEILLLDSGERREIFKGGTYARYVKSGHLVFAHETSLFAAPFDLDSLTLTGSTVPVLEGVSTGNQGGALFDVSRNGHLVFATGGGSEVGLQLVRVDRNGTLTPLSENARTFGNPELSPDGKFLAVGVAEEGKNDIWVYDLDRGLPTRVSSGVGNNWAPIWSPDGEWIFHAVGGAGTFRIERIAADGSGQSETVLESESLVRPLSLSPDGKRLLYAGGTLSQPDLHSFWFDRGESEPFMTTPAIEYDARFSPDGRWIAYGSNGSGTFEIYVVPAAGGRGRWQISSAGGFPRWSGDGKTLFYRGLDDAAVYEVPLETGGGTLRAGRPRQVVAAGSFFFESSGTNHYSAATDGQSFVLMLDPTGTTATHDHVNLVLDWLDALSAITDGP